MIEQGQQIIVSFFLIRYIIPFVFVLPSVAHHPSFSLLKHVIFSFSSIYTRTYGDVFVYSVCYLQIIHVETVEVF
jgi:hypothetical protein